MTNANHASVDHLVIIAGGEGARLASVAGDVPKALVPIGGKPVLQHQLELAAASGVRDVTIFAGHLGEKIADFVGDGSRFGLAVRVLTETEPMGNAGALLGALDRLPEHFFAVYGDVMLAVDFAKMARQHLERQADLTMLVHPNDHPYDSDLIETDANGWTTAIHAYPHWEDRFFSNLVNAGLYAIRRDGLRPFVAGPAKRDFTKGILAGLLAARARVLAYRTTEYIKDMGTPARLKKVEEDWRAGRIRPAEWGVARPAIFLDRDGTLNVEKGHLRRHQDLELVPGAGAALKLLREAGFYLVVLTNQPVIARGEASEEDVAAIHRRLEWELGKEGAYLDAIYHCPHHPDRGFAGERAELKIRCECRKPSTGLFERARRELNIDAARSWMIGDQPSDIEMARRAGLRPVLVRHSSTEERDVRYPAAPDYTAADLADAARVILQHLEPTPEKQGALSR